MENNNIKREKRFIFSDDNSDPDIYLTDLKSIEDVFRHVTSYFVDYDTTLTSSGIKYLRDIITFEKIAELAEKNNSDLWTFNSYENAMELLENEERELQEFPIE